MKFNVNFCNKFVTLTSAISASIFASGKYKTLEKSIKPTLILVILQVLAVLARWISSLSELKGQFGRQRAGAEDKGEIFIVYANAKTGNAIKQVF